MNSVQKSMCLKIISCYCTNLRSGLLVRRYCYSVLGNFKPKVKCHLDVPNKNINYRFRPEISGNLFNSNSYLTSPLTNHYINRFYSDKPKSKQGCSEAHGKVREKTEADSDEVKDDNLSMFQKLKQMYRDYWYVLIPVHCGTSVIWFGSFYFIAKSGVDIVSLLEFLHVTETVIETFRKGHSSVTAGYLAVAFALYKLMSPFRYAVTLGAATVSINYLKRLGYIKPKPIPKKEQLKEMYLEKKDILREKKQQLTHKFTLDENKRKK